MQKITSHLWFDREAREAARFYTDVFGGRILSEQTIENTPSGTVDIVDIEVYGHQFSMISAGPLFKFTPAISFLIACETAEEVDRLWARLNDGGATMMPLDAYPFSDRYGWTADRYGLSWQVMLSREPVRQKITPVLMFTGDNAGRAEEAINFYTSVFRNTSSAVLMRYPAGSEHDREGTVQWASFTLEGQEFAAMDSGYPHGFTFNEAISLLVHCDDQQEVDDFWDKLSAVPEAEACGWLKDRYGVAWQIVPKAMTRMMATKDRAALARVTEAFLKMKKFDIAALEAAYAG